MTFNTQTLPNTGVSLGIRGAIFTCMLIPAFLEANGSDELLTAKYRTISPWSSQIWQTRPVRRDTPLREENITDREVLQIEGVMKEMYPGAIVYISGVTTDCPCEDGPKCTDQVWSVATQVESSGELALSRIDGEWQIGPLQQWWLVRDRIWDLYKESRKQPDVNQGISFREYVERINEHNLAFPRCEVEQLAIDD